jgi:hypothetical protein
MQLKLLLILICGVTIALPVTGAKKQASCCVKKEVVPVCCCDDALHSAGYKHSAAHSCICIPTLPGSKPTLPGDSINLSRLIHVVAIVGGTPAARSVQAGLPLSLPGARSRSFPDSFFPAYHPRL